MITYDLDDLVRVAKRENNEIRPYLYVGPLQGKHMSVAPDKSLELFKYMADLIVARYPSEKILVVGFAETATAIGAGIAFYADNVQYVAQTTREHIADGEYLYFTESHSHATEQGIIVDDYLEVLKEIDRIVFAEDEITTGNTIMKLVDGLNMQYPQLNLKYSVLCILNSIMEQRISQLEQAGVECICVSKMLFEYKIHEIEKYVYSDHTYELINQKKSNKSEIVIKDKLDIRKTQGKEAYVLACNRFVAKLMPLVDIKEEYKKILVLGTEEFMFLPMYFANHLLQQFQGKQVDYHATTRSPILVSDDEGYPLFNRYQLPSFYDENRVTYIYNLERYDYVIVITDAEETTSGSDKIIAALEHEGNENIQIVRWSK